MVEELFPFDHDAPMMLTTWLDELERARCIERYKVDGGKYLRIVDWRRLQVIDRPTRSRLPPAPSEAREAREPREETPESALEQDSEADAREAAIEKIAAPLGDGSTLTPTRIMGYLERAIEQSSGEEDVNKAAHARYLDMAGRARGLWHSRAKVADDAQGPPEERSVSPAAFHGLPVTRSND